ncbi:MAG: lipoyl(octanoyl) transferase LipB [Deltaproteobacteria bacterium]|nr:lipoyl(octanoyl) transferase LipB [Deltaproteobacteria bacterium]
MESSWLGHLEYRKALQVQMECVEMRASGEIPDTLLLLTHPHVYTIGRVGSESNLLVSAETLNREGISVERVSRGGDITYHGPGQLVGYPIVRLSKPDVHRFVRGVEGALIEALSEFGIRGRRIEGLTGVWVEDRKIASIGIGVRRWVTYHGFALNVDTDLSYFRRIHLCGLKGREATSIRDVAGRDLPMDTIRQSVAFACEKHLRGFS